MSSLNSSYIFNFFVVFLLFFLSMSLIALNKYSVVLHSILFDALCKEWIVNKSAPLKYDKWQLAHTLKNTSWYMNNTFATGIHVVCLFWLIVALWHHVESRNYVIIGSGNSLSPLWHQAITLISSQLFSIWHSESNFSDIPICICEIFKLLHAKGIYIYIYILLRKGLQH